MHQTQVFQLILIHLVFRQYLVMDNLGVSTYATSAGIAYLRNFSWNCNLRIKRRYLLTPNGWTVNKRHQCLSTQDTLPQLVSQPYLQTHRDLLEHLILLLIVLQAGELIVSGVTTLGVVTGATYYGDGTNLTGLVLENTTQSFNQLIVSGMSTLGFLTGCPINFW